MGLLEEWVSEAHEEVLLPSGRWVKWLEPDPEDLIRLRLFPQQLRLAVIASNGDEKRAAASLDKLTANPEAALEAADEVRDGLIIASIRGIRKSPDDEWETVTMTREQFVNLPVKDRAALRDIIDQRMTPKSVTAVVLYQRGEISQAAAQAIVEASAKEVVPGWESFRDLRPGAVAGGAGQGLGDPPVVLDRRPRRDRRARAG